MIILFDENETLFSGLGLGVLRDAISCTVTESLNDEYTLAMEYPVKGNIFSQLQLNRIIYCRPNPYSSAQPFRIYSITKPLDGKVSVAAYHISYDMNDVPVGTINGQNIQDTLNQIQNGVIIDDCPFKLYTDMTSTKKFKTTSPYNMRALLMGSDESILEKYDAEVRFDKWNAYITKQRGKNRGVQVRYAKNMTELSHELNYERLYNGVYPFYHKETTSTTSTTTTGDFKQVYIVGKKPYQAGWLSYSAGGTAYQPVDESPVQIASDGDWKGKVYCWDSVTQRYVEKLYNQTVTLVQGVISPDWIKIDWGSLPKIVCQAAADGYFKTTTDTTWTYHASGETVFEGSITDISGLASNMILYYSEVIPSDSTSSADTDTNITHVELPEKIIWLNTDDAKAMKRNRILMLDLSSEFGDDDEDDDEDDTSTSTTTTTTTTDEDGSDSDDSDDDSDVPTVDELRAKAEKYIKKNKIGTIKFETSLSFVDLASTTEKEKYKDFEQIELGDTVKVVYNEMGIDIDLRVITTEYDVLKNAYEQVELGEKSDTLSASSVQNGDDISSLTNDSDYASTSTVSKLIAKTVTADYIQAQNAKLTSAQITELTSARIKCTGILEASQLELDKLVATMLIADDAEIANTLSAGQVKVAGDISVNSGQISITNGEKVFNVTREGDLTANSVTITGGSLNINNGTFEVTNDGLMTATGADISGRIQATDGIIGGFTIGENAIYNSITGMEDQTSNGVYLGVDGIKLGDKFSVTPAGLLTTTSGKIGSYTINNSVLWYGFSKDPGTDYLSYPGVDGIFLGPEALRIGNATGYEFVAVNLKKDLAKGVSVYCKRMPYAESKLLTRSNNVTFEFKTSSSDETRSFALEFYDSPKDGSKKEDYTTRIAVYPGVETVDVQLTYDETYSYLYITNTSGTDVVFASGTTMTTKLTGGIMLVRDEGKLIANNVEIIGGSLDINKGVFSVDPQGNMVAKSAKIDGTITAKSGGIGGFKITEKGIYSADGNIQSMDSAGTKGIYICSDGIRVGASYKITPDGAFSAGSGNTQCGIDNNGELTATGATIVGTITATKGFIGTEDAGFYINSNCIYSRAYSSAPNTYKSYPSVSGIYIGNDAIRVGKLVTERYYASQSYVYSYSSGALTYDSWGSKNAPGLTGLPILINFNSDSSVDRTLYIQAVNSSDHADYGPMNIAQAIPAKSTSCMVTASFNSEYYRLRIMSGAGATFENVSFSIYPTGVLMKSDGNLIASNATIYGSFNGDVNISEGSLNIGNGKFSVTNAGAVSASDIKITGGSLDINNGTFKVTNDGAITATSGYIGKLQITDTGLKYDTKFYINPANEQGFHPIPGTTPIYSIHGDSAQFDNLLLSVDTISSGDGDYYSYFGYRNRGLVTNFISQDGSIDNLRYESQIPAGLLRNIPVIGSYTQWGYGIDGTEQPSLGSSRCPKISFIQIKNVPSAGYTINASDFGLTYIFDAVASCVNSYGFAYCSMTIGGANTSITVYATQLTSGSDENQSVDVIIFGR